MFARSFDSYRELYYEGCSALTLYTYWTPDLCRAAHTPQSECILGTRSAVECLVCIRSQNNNNYNSTNNNSKYHNNHITWNMRQQVIFTSYKNYIINYFVWWWGLKISHKHTMCVQDHNRQSALRKNRKEVGGAMYKQTKWMNVLLGT